MYFCRLGAGNKEPAYDIKLNRRKNNMKNKTFNKNKILIPALAILALTTTASVTSTVAWFTANRNVTVTANQFAAVAMDGSLTVATAKGVGMSDPTGTEIARTIGVNGYLTDGSYNVAAGKLFTDNPAGPTKYRELGALNNSDLTTNNPWHAGVNKTDNKEVWYAVSWTSTFTYNFNNTVDSQALIFNLSSTFSDKTKANAGFRIAMICGAKKLVWANDTVDSVVKDTGATETQTLVATNPSYTAKNDGVITTGDTEYLGTFTTASNTLEVTFVAWYEGTDAAVETENLITGTPITAEMKFYARTLA